MLRRVEHGGNLAVCGAFQLHQRSPIRKAIHDPSMPIRQTQKVRMTSPAEIPRATLGDHDAGPRGDSDARCCAAEPRRVVDAQRPLARYDPHLARIWARELDFGDVFAVV